VCFVHSIERLYREIFELGSGQKKQFTEF